MTLASRRVSPGVTAIVTVVSDTFTGTAGTSLSAHTADTGQSWTIQTAAATFIIVGGTQAQMNNSTLQASAVVSTAVANATVAADCTHASGSDYGLLWRGSDDTNYFIANLNGTIYKRVAGSFTSLGTFTAGASGDRLSATFSGTTHTVYKNGIQVATFTESFNQTAVLHGLRGNAVGQWDNFKVTVP